MLSLKTIEDFTGIKDVAVIGASSNKKKFGYIILDHLIKKGYNAVPVNPKAGEILGIKCFPDIQSLPENFKAVIFVTKPDVTEMMTKEICAGNKVEYLWYQQGSYCKRTIDIALSSGKKIIYGECILMYTKSSGFPHGLHRFFKKTFGKYPK